MSEFEPAWLQKNGRKGKCSRCRADVEPDQGYVEPPTAIRVGTRGDYMKLPWSVFCAACGEARRREINGEKAKGPIGIPCWQGGSVRFRWEGDAIVEDEVNIHITDAEGTVTVKGYHWRNAALEIGLRVLENRKQIALARAEGKKDW